MSTHPIHTTSCPRCKSHSLKRLRRSRVQKIRRIRAIYRCENCGERFEIKKPAFNLFDVWLKRAQIK